MYHCAKITKVLNIKKKKNKVQNIIKKQKGGGQEYRYVFTFKDTDYLWNDAQENSNFGCERWMGN